MSVVSRRFLRPCFAAIKTIDLTGSVPSALWSLGRDYRCTEHYSSLYWVGWFNFCRIWYGAQCGRRCRFPDRNIYLCPYHNWLYRLGRYVGSILNRFLPGNHHYRRSLSAISYSNKRHRWLAEFDPASTTGSFSVGTGINFLWLDYVYAGLAGDRPRQHCLPGLIAKSVQR